jgi:hypothetical protein
MAGGIYGDTAEAIESDVVPLLGVLHRVVTVLVYPGDGYAASSQLLQQFVMPQAAAGYVYPLHRDVITRS